MLKKTLALVVILAGPGLARADDSRITMPHLLAESDAGCTLRPDCPLVLDWEKTFRGIQARLEPTTDARLGQVLVLLKDRLAAKRQSFTGYQAALYLEARLPRQGKTNLTRLYAQLEADLKQSPGK